MKVKGLVAEAMPTMSKKSKKPEDYEVENWADTLMKAEDIKGDPEKMGHVQRHLAKKQKAIRSIADLRQAAKDLKDKAP